MASFDRLSSTTVTVPAASRMRQGLRALLGLRSSLSQSLPARYRTALPIRVVEKWDRLAPYDRRHLLAVASNLRSDGHADEVVLAGLLHDIGKPDRLSVATRATAVVIERIGKDARSRTIEISFPVPWFRQLQATLRHATAGADLLSRHDVSPQVVWLVRHHDSDLSHPDLQALRAADARH